jgi:outer membrane lipase/esterase
MNRLSLSAPRSLLGAALVALGLLAGCGGATQIERFEPTRLLVFGDELSVIDDSASPGNGRKYTVNALSADNLAIVCSNNPLWVQSLAASFGLVLPQCNPNAVAAPASRIYAVPNARAAELAAQVDQHLLAGGNFSAKDLATVLVGMHDVLDQYARYPAVGQDQLVAAVEQAGTTVGATVNRIAQAGGKVLIATVPDMGLTPFALAQNTSTGDPTRAALLTRLTARFNAKLRTTLPEDGGRSIGLVLADELTQLVAKNPTTSGFANVIDASCDPALAPTLPQCTTQTLVTAATTTTYLWADTLRPGPIYQRNLGSLAITRARGNPF